MERPVVFVVSAALSACAAGAPAPQDPVPTNPPPQARVSEAPPPRQPEWGADDAASYVIPALEIVGFEVALNQVDRHFGSDSEAYESDASTIEKNLESGWVIDRDPFGMNQLGHPYSGALYHGFARSTGHGYWVSFVYTFLGSALWEVAGETEPPSLNDQITTGVGGTFLGEAMFRSASWIVEDPTTGAGSEIGAALLSPPLAFNRLVFDRFDGIFPSHAPAVTAHIGGGVRSDTFVDGDSTREERTDATAEYSIEYGLPGKAGYAYDRPFDYYQLEIAGMSDSDNHFAHVRARGLLFGGTYGDGDLAGVHGLYGIYDYLSPGLFRVASTALAYGTTAQLTLSPTIALQGTALAGAGFGAAGAVADDVEDRNYHYGGIPQAVVDWRLTFGDVLMLESSARDYVVIGVSSDSDYGTENIFQADVAVMLRVVGGHALRVEYVASARDTEFADLGEQGQSIGTLTIGYAFLGSSRWGVMR
jgi:hypothetical protein